MSDSRRFYVIDVAPNWRHYLPWDAGEAIQKVLREQGAPVGFIWFRDLAGSDVTVQGKDICSLYGSTPETRARDFALAAEREAEAKALQPPEWMP